MTNHCSNCGRQARALALFNGQHLCAPCVVPAMTPPFISEPFPAPSRGSRVVPNPDYKPNRRNFTTMIVCTTCGNKRCPRATDPNLDCTNSNDAGQPGSSYQ